MSLRYHNTVSSSQVAAAALTWLPVWTAIFIGIALFKQSYIDTLLLGDTGVIGSWDGAHYYFWLRSIVIDRDVDFMNEALYFNAWPDYVKFEVLALPRTDTGLLQNKYTIGWAILSLPFFLAAHFVAHCFVAFGIPVATNGYSTPYQFALALGQAGYAVSSLILSAKIVSRECKTTLPLSYSLVCLTWLSSFMLLYQTSELFMVHNATYFCAVVAFALTQNISTHVKPITLAAIGVACGLLVLCRMQTIVYLIYPGVSLVFLSRELRQINVILIPAIAFLLVLSLQLIAWKQLYGVYFFYSYGNEGFNWLSPRLGSVLFSDYHGLFYWHPIYLIGLFGLVMKQAIRPTILGMSLGASVLATIYINAAWHNWWFGASFGSRAFECTTIAIMIGIGCIAKASSGLKQQIILIGMFTPLIFWNGVMTLAAMWTHLPLDRPVTIHEKFSVVPQTIRQLLKQ